MRSNDGEGEDAKGVKAMQKYLEAGKVVTTHGVRGEMKLELWCDGVDFLKKVGLKSDLPCCIMGYIKI